MPENRATGPRFESYVDRRIREAQERGDFDRLPGVGRPLRDLHHQRDDLWWVRRKFREERLSWLPPALELRRDRDEALQRIAESDSERQVRDIVSAMNAHIRQANRLPMSGPPSTVAPLDEERIVEQWRARRPRHS